MDVDLLAVYGCRVAVAAVLLSAAATKTLRWAGFRTYLSRAAGISALPSSLQRPLGLGTTMMEGVLGALVAAGVGDWLVPAAVICFTYLASGFLALQFVHSDAGTECPCWGTASRTTRDVVRDVDSATPTRVARDLLRPAGYGVRNSALCAAAIYLTTASGQGIAYWWAWSGIPLILIALGLVVSIVTEHRKLRRERHPRYDGLAPLLAPLVMLDSYQDQPRAATLRARDSSA